MATRKTAAMTRTTIGWVETVRFPDWDIELTAKIDTGAKSSALHVENVRLLPKNRVSFDVVVNSKTGERRTVETTVARRGRVRPSSGQTQERLFVTTRLQLGPECHEVELSLVDRERMLYRMLVGRTYLARRFVVDVSRRQLMRKLMQAVEG